MLTIFATGQAAFDVFGNHNAVVHQQAERNDDGAHRDVLKLDVHRAHDDECTEDRQRHDHAHDDPGAPTEK